MRKSKIIAITNNTSHYIIVFRLNLIRALQENGCRVIAIAPTDKYSLELEKHGVEYIPVDIDNKGTNPAKDAKLLVSLYKIYKATRPDAILHFTIKPNIYGSIAAGMLKIPVINNVTGLGTAFLSGGPLQYISERMYRFAFKKANKVFFQNDIDHKFFLGKNLVNILRSEVIPGSGVDTTRFSPRIHTRQKNKFVFLLIARVIKDKGILEYIEAAEILKSRGINFESRLLGQIGSENRGALSQNDVNSWVAKGLINYLGEHEDVRDAIADADCIVLPSYREGTSKSLLESAAMGKPIIASDVPGCNNVVEDGFTGYLCKPRNALDLANKMEAMINLPATIRNKFGEAGRKKMTMHFDEKIVIKRYLEALSLVDAST